jgi:uncharacterized protein
MSFGLIRVVIAISILVLLYLSQRFWFRSLWSFSERLRPVWQKVLRGVALFALGFLILFLAARLFGHGLWQRRGGLPGTIVALLQLWIMSSLMAYVFFKVVRGIGGVWQRVGDAVSRNPAPGPQNVQRRDFFRYAARFAAAVPLVAAVYGFAAERFDYRVRRVEIPVANLPPALDGLTIAQLSDIHIGDFMPRAEVRRAVDMANSLGADLAVVTGDFLTGRNDPLADCIAELSRLRAPLGVWGCNGNHEIYADAEEEAQRLFALHGMKLLRQETATLTWRGAKVNLIGVDYQRDHMVKGPTPPMLAGIEPLVRRDMPNILLSHNPNSFDKAAELGIELSLAGHTHGGQVQVEILNEDVNPARFITKFIAGLYQLPMTSAGGSPPQSKAALYVNRGLGTIGIPARFGVDPEISLLTLRRASEAPSP